ncbi:MAG TPA: hypothetical protein VGU43_01010 [Thermoplasmata archaeon]|nr:hypothetical protein [Thermoplasmata archaeon]
MPRRRRWRSLVALPAAALAAVLLVGMPAAALVPPGPSPVSFILNPNGSLLANLTVEIPNGSLLRYAIDGNFTPLLNALPISAANRSNYEAQIAFLESNPFTAGDFGTNSGTVSSGEVGVFDRLVLQESAYLPSGALTGGFVFAMTLDGQKPSSASLQAFYALDALGPDSSAAPLNVSVTTQYSFPISGSSHTLGFSWTLPPLLLSAYLDFDVTFLTPAGDTITGSSGFGLTAVHNDVYGFSPGKFTGTLTPSGNGSANVEFGPAFPLGTILIVAAVVAAGAIGIGFLLLRGRRRRRASLSTSPAGPSTGESSPAAGADPPAPAP